MPPTNPLELMQVQVKALYDAIIGTLEKPGIIQELRDHTRKASEHAAKLEDHEARIATLEATPGRKALDLWERIGLLAAGVLLAALSSLAMAGLRAPAQAPPGVEVKR